MNRLLSRLRASKTAFWAGVILLIVNPPLGWIGFMIGGYLAAKYHQPKYMLIATILYGITWGMAGAGVLLAGPKGVTLAKQTLKNIWKKTFKRKKSQNKKTLQNEKPWNRTSFLLLSWLAYAMLALFLIGMFYLAYPRLHHISPTSSYFIGAIFAIALIVLGGGLLLITLTSITGLDLLYPHGRMQITMRILPPVVYILGASIFRLDKDKLRESFVAVSNELFWAQARNNRFSPERLLILLPHCLQWHECQWKITWSIENCRKCGKCALGSLAELHGRMGISVYVATGGTIARRVVAEAKPTLILAVACSRDLSEGMVDVYPIPVFGILLSRPFGPCFDTELEMQKVFKFLQKFRPDAKEALIGNINKNELPKT